MAKRKTQRTFEFTIRVVFDKAVTPSVARKEAHGSLVGFSDWTDNGCVAGTLKVTALKPAPSPPPQSNVVGITISEAEAKALLYGLPKHEFTAAMSRLAKFLAEEGSDNAAEPDAEAAV